MAGICIRLDIPMSGDSSSGSSGDLGGGALKADFSSVTSWYFY